MARGTTSSMWELRNAEEARLLEAVDHAALLATYYDYRELFDEVLRRGFDGGACGAHLTGGEPGKPSFGVVLRLADPETCLEELAEP